MHDLRRAQEQAQNTHIIVNTNAHVSFGGGFTSDFIGILYSSFQVLHRHPKLWTAINLWKLANKCQLSFFLSHSVTLLSLSFVPSLFVFVLGHNKQKRQRRCKPDERLLSARSRHQRSRREFSAVCVCVCVKCFYLCVVGRVELHCCRLFKDRCYRSERAHALRRHLVPHPAPPFTFTSRHPALNEPTV